MMEAARQNGVKTFVYASSSSVYGDEAHLPKQEGVEGNLLSPYALTKRADEEWGKRYTKHYGLKTIGLRYFNVFGRRQDPHGAGCQSSRLHRPHTVGHHPPQRHPTQASGRKQSHRPGLDLPHRTGRRNTSRVQRFSGESYAGGEIEILIRYPNKRRSSINYLNFSFF